MEVAGNKIMNEFQAVASIEVEGLLGRLNAQWSKEVIATERRPLGENPGDVFLKYSVVSGVHQFEVYVYIRDIGLMFDGEWFIYEEQGYRDPAVRVSVFQKELLAKLGA